MRTRYFVALAALGAVGLAACGGGGSYSSGSKPVQGAVVAKQMTGTVVKSGNTSLGTVLVSSSGRTLYGLTTDTKTHSSCSGACASIWPPVLVGPGWTAAPGLDAGTFSTIVRADGSRQLEAGRWPLYTYSGDTKPGDVNGEGSGGVWFAAGTDGVLVKSAPSSAATMASTGY